MYQFRLTDEQWQAIQPVMAITAKLETRGRPRRSNREIVDAVLTLFWHGGSLRDISYNHVPYQTVARRLSEWRKRGMLTFLIEALAKDMEKRSDIRLRDCFKDSQFEGIEKYQPGKIIFMDEIGPIYLDDPPVPTWQEATKEFFETPRVWHILFSHPSPWLYERFPSNLNVRLRYV